MKILNTIGTKFNADAKKILGKAGRVEYRVLAQPQLESLVLRGKFDYDVLVLGLGLYLHKAILRGAKSLKLIATATTGLDHINVKYAGKIKILNLRDENLSKITGTAELAFGLILSLARKIPFAFADVRKGNWNREKFVGHNLYGKTLGIVGLGRLGSQMAQYGTTFGMRVMAFDPNKKSSKIAKLVKFDRLLRESDVISIHASLNNKNVGMFNQSAFNRMKKTAYLINTARGQIVNEEFLLRALKNKTIGGYAMDVLALEKHEGFLQNRIYKDLLKYAKTHDNLIITPHIGGMTEESRAATDIIIAKKVAQYFSQ